MYIFVVHPLGISILNLNASYNVLKHNCLHPKHIELRTQLMMYL